MPLSAASVSPRASTTTPGQSSTRTPFSSTTSWTSLVHPGVGATEHALLRLRVLMRLLLPTLGCPMRPIVRLCLTFVSFDDVGAPELRKPLMSSMSGFVDEPEAEEGVWSDDAERCVRCCCVDDLNAIVGACSRRWASHACTTGGGTRSAKGAARNQLFVRSARAGKGRTNLVEHKNELLATTVETPELALDSPAARADGVASVEDLDEDVARLEHLAQTLGVELETRVGDLGLGPVRVVAVLGHLVLEALRVGRERGRECGSRGECGARRRSRALGFPTSDLLLLSLRTNRSASAEAAYPRQGRAYANLLGLLLGEQLVLEREAVGDANVLGLVCSRYGVSSLVPRSTPLLADALLFQVTSFFASFLALRCDSPTLRLILVAMCVVVRREVFFLIFGIV